MFVISNKKYYLQYATTGIQYDLICDSFTCWRDTNPPSASHSSDFIGEVNNNHSIIAKFIAKSMTNTTFLINVLIFFCSLSVFHPICFLRYFYHSEKSFPAYKPRLSAIHHQSSELAEYPTFAQYF